ncbi:type II toxin-antitoxin system HipA family toxin [Nigerium massiliense]|uniref:type II toxin-antitoxin system HipA family toxin n=1 Tax=Nigerium massiliense TaxID=1522317 RepID=UPI0006940EFC|nr:HipA domain-containing protein [Nigerium massiliense]
MSQSRRHDRLPDAVAGRGHADARAVERAVVHKDGVPAATLTRGDGGTTFAYLPDYAGPDVAHTLPKGRPPVFSPAGSVPAFFAGLLPEGRRLQALRRSVKTSADDELSLLLAVGANTVGDVQVVPEGVAPVEPEPHVELAEPRYPGRYADLFAPGAPVDRVALPGAQEKLSAGMLTLPATLASREAILKVSPPDYPGVVANEHYFLAQASGLKLPVVRSEIVPDAAGEPGLLIGRFDRPASGRPSRLAVEDATQLLGVHPGDKYRVTAEQLVEAVADACAARVVALRSVLLQLIWAWLTGNGDLHAKNVSVLAEPSGEWRVAPLYDVPSTLPFGDHTAALSMGGRTEGFVRRHFVDFGVDVGLPRIAAERAVDQALAASAGVIDDVAGGVLGLNANLTRTVVRQLTRRRRDAEG